MSAENWDFKLDNFILKLFQRQKDSFLTWIRMHDPDNQRAFDLSRTSAMIASPVYYASLLGLGRVLHELLNSKQVENVMTDFVPLRFTSERGS